MAVNITKKPSPKPTNIILRRGDENDGNSIDALWGVPADALTETSHQWGALDEYWTFEASTGMTSGWKQQRGDGHVMADKVWVRDKGADHQSNTMWYDRTKYHPVKPGRHLEYVNCLLSAQNSKGKTNVGKRIWFKKPLAPTIADPVFDSQNNSVSFTMTRPDESDLLECYDFRYCIARRDCKSLNTSYSDRWVEDTWTSTTSEEATKTYNLSLGRAIAVGEWVVVECRAYSRGLKGDSPVATNRFVYAYPAYAYIESVKTGKVRTSLSPVYISVKIAYAVDANKKRTYLDPVDTIKLQILYNTSLSTRAAAEDSNEWADVDGAVDDGACIGFYDNASTAMPDVGKHTWYRVVTQHGQFTRISHAYEAKCLFRKSDEVANDKAKITELVPGSDGESIEGVVGWKNDDSTTTEISWSTNQGGWWSNNQPDSMDITWADSSSQVAGYAHSATFYITGLENGETYFVRARRKQVDGDTVTNGPWQFPPASMYPITLVEAPEDVRITAPAVIARGKGIPCTWSFNGPEQTEWKLYRTGIANSKRWYRTIASGKGPRASYTVPVSKTKNPNNTNLYLESADLVVDVTCGGNWSSSNIVTVMIDQAPTIAVSAADTLTAQPLSVTLTSNSSEASVYLKVASHLGITYEKPDGMCVQDDGDVVWSDFLGPKDIGWTSSNGSYTATYTLPSGLDFVENGMYKVTATAQSRYGLTSAQRSDIFDVEWAHQALPPSDATVSVDEASLSATLTPEPPDGAAVTDVCDIYRVTPDGAYVIARDVEFGESVMDPYCPFSNTRDAELAYRFCTRTIDGDIQWSDTEYSLSRTFMRIDWDGDYVELPYGVAVSDSWPDDGFELQKRLDGSRPGFWDAGYTRETSVSLDLARGQMWDETSKVRALGQSSFPCFVRTNDGCAYEANVSVDSMEMACGAGSIPVSMKITEIDLDEQFMAVPVDEQGESGESGGGGD